jgi:hypothetical protein
MSVISSSPVPMAQQVADPEQVSSSNSISLKNTLNLSQRTNKSSIYVNVKELNLKLYNEIIISWNILENTSNQDWIGIYRPSADSNSYLEMRHVTGSKIGHITWSLSNLKSMQSCSNSKSESSSSSSPLRYNSFLNNLPNRDLNKSKINDKKRKISQDDALEFRYYNFNNDLCIAKSITLRVIASSSSETNNNQNNMTSSSSSSSSFDSFSVNTNSISSSLVLSSNSKSKDEEFLTFKISGK